MSAAPVTPLEGSARWLRSHRTLALGSSLGLLVTVAAATAGTARFTGARWVPHWHPAGPAPASQRGRLRAPPVQEPKATSGRGPDVPLGTVLLWVSVSIGVIAVVYLAWRLIAGRSSRATRRRLQGPALAPSAAVSEPEPQAPVIRRGVEQALRLLGEERTPGDAVMLAWLGLEQSAEDSGIVRRAAETATELTSRITKRVFADDRAIATLLALYLRARFSDYEVTPADVARARQALEGLVRSWDAGASSISGARLSGSTR